MFLNTILSAIPCKVHKAKFARKRGIFGFYSYFIGPSEPGFQGAITLPYFGKNTSKTFSFQWPGLDYSFNPNPSEFLDLPSALRNIGRQVGPFETIIITDRHYSRVVSHKL